MQENDTRPDPEVLLARLKEEEQEEVVTNLYFGSDYLDAMENEQMFLLFVNRQNIYIFSKKCLSEEEQNKLREIFTEKSIL